MNRYTNLTKLFITAVLAILAILVPFVIMRIVFAFAAAVVFALSLKKFTALLIVLTVIFIMIPVSAFWATHLYFDNKGYHELDRRMQQWIGGIFNSRTGDYNYEYNYNYDYNYEPGIGFKVNTLIKPDVYIESARYLEIKGGGFRIEFDDSTDQIYLPNSMNVDRSGSSLILSSPRNFHNYNARIVIGTKNIYKSIKIDCGAIEISGNINTDLFTVESAAVDLEGIYNVKTLDINAEVAEINMELNSTERVELNGVALSGKVKYLDNWEGTRKMIIDCVVGSMEVLTSSENYGELNIERDTAVFKLDRTEY